MSRQIRSDATSCVATVCRLTVLFFLHLSLSTCDPAPPHAAPTPERAFYHWQTRLTVPPPLLENDATRVYTKVFDVSWKDNRATPTALLQIGDTTKPADYVPVIFLTNEVFTHPADSLAPRVLRLLDRSFPFPYTELQLDCDWTAGTRAAYFAFLETLQRLRPQLTLSCTVRLHQYRDRRQQGIPPVDRAVLMAYNTGDLGRWETTNSIVDSAVIESYVRGQSPYPLPLDLAVAAYDWAVVYRQGRLAYLINEPELEELADTTRFTALTPLRYRVRKGTYYGGLYLYAGDLMRREIVTRPEAERLIDWLWPRVATPGSRYAIIYRLNSRQWVSPLPPL